MKSIKEQTREAAENHYKEWNKYPSNGVKDDCMDDFIAGVEWERSREKWISVEDELPGELETVWISNGESWTTLGCLFEGVWGATNGIIYEEAGKIISECEQDDLDVKFWQSIPEPPKQK